MVKKLLLVCFSFLLAVFVVNLGVFLYERPVAWIDTPNGASRGVRNPYSTMVHGTEGYSISKIDEFGFTNQPYLLNNNYVLMMGASHSQGKEISINNRYSSLVNFEIVGGRKELGTLNIAADGHFLPSIVKHFKSAITNYSNAKCITIEIGSTDYSIDELKDAFLQIETISNDTAKELFKQQSKASLMKNIFKEYVPLLSIINSNIQTARKTNSVGGGYSVNEDEYRSVITECLTLIRSQYDGPIVFVYHPGTEIQNDGTIKIVRSQTLDTFKEVCAGTDIDFIDTGAAFLEHYNEYHELPYGFANTTPGSGHLNEVGHKIMADTIIDYLEEVGCK